MAHIYLLQIILRIPLDQKIFLGIGIFKQERNYEFYLKHFISKSEMPHGIPAKKLPDKLFLLLQKGQKPGLWPMDCTS